LDISSLAIGIAIGIIGAFGTGFLKKAGDDFYSLLKVKINPKATATVIPQVVVRLHNDDRGDTQSDVALPDQLAPAAIERLSEISFDDIEKAIDSAPPMQREDIAERYVGLNVEWDTYLRSANRLDGGEVFLRLAIDKSYRGRSVYCRVKADEYRVLGILPMDAHIRVAGQIAKAGGAAGGAGNSSLNSALWQD